MCRLKCSSSLKQDRFWLAINSFIILYVIPMLSFICDITIIVEMWTTVYLYHNSHHPLWEQAFKFNHNIDLNSKDLNLMKKKKDLAQLRSKISHYRVSSIFIIGPWYCYWTVFIKIIVYKISKIHYALVSLIVEYSSDHVNVFCALPFKCADILCPLLGVKMDF